MQFVIKDRGDSYSQEIGQKIKEACVQMGFVYDVNTPELVICIGGDGTILRAVHDYIDILDSVSFIGIHTGTLGFLTDYTSAEVEIFLEDLKNMPWLVQEKTLLEMEMPEREKTIYAFNEIRVESFSKTLKLLVYIDNEFFETTAGSGICVCTQSGSTAVNRALNGAVIDSSIDALELCEIMPIAYKDHHSLRNPFIMNTNRIISIYGDTLEYAYAVYDHLETSLENVHHIVIRAANKKVRFLRLRIQPYLKRLKSLY